MHGIKGYQRVLLAVMCAVLPLPFVLVFWRLAALIIRPRFWEAVYDFFLSFFNGIGLIENQLGHPDMQCVYIWKADGRFAAIGWSGR